MAKYLDCIQLGGGMDGMNLVSPRDSTSVTLLQANRQGSPTHVLDYTDALTKVSTITAGNAAISVSNTTNIVTGMLVYSVSLPAVRGLTVSSIGTNQVTLSGLPFVSASGETVTFATATQLLKVNEPGTRNLGLHYTQKLLWDVLNTPDTVGNANKPKGALVCSVSPMRKPLSLLNGQMVLRGTSTPVGPNDTPALLFSHNDQTSTVQSNAAEGSIKGWGGGIADHYISGISAPNAPLSVVSATNLPVFCAGAVAQAFSISGDSLVSPLPNTLGLASYEPDVTVNTAYEDLLLQSAQNVLADDDWASSANSSSKLSIDFQKILVDVQEITDIPSGLSFNIAGSSPVNATTFAKNLKQSLRMKQANSPNRGVTCTRSGNTVTVATEVSDGFANRVAGSTTVEITCTNHRLFTSTTSTNITDSVVVTSADATAIDTAAVPNGYKITLLASDVNNKFTYVGSANTALVNQPVKVRLKHNFGTFNKVYFEAAGFDTPTNPNGYQVASVIDLLQFNVTTVASGAFASGTISTKAKLINLPKQVTYLEAGYSWDNHTECNHSQLAGLNVVLAYYIPIVSRMVDADTVTFINTEFGRGVSTNSNGTDHGWSNNLFVIGNSVRKGVYGDIMDYSTNGIHRQTSGHMVPSTSLYQYGATLAKWMGSTDAQILELFPDLVNWPLAERNLGFLNALV